MHRDGLTDAQISHMMYHHLRSEIDNALGISHHFTFKRDALLGLLDDLALEDRVIAEFTPDDNGYNDTEVIADFDRKMDEWLPSLDGHNRREEFQKRVEVLKSRFLQHGISRPPQLVMLGRKS